MRPVVTDICDTLPRRIRLSVVVLIDSGRVRRDLALTVCQMIYQLSS